MHRDIMEEQAELDIRERVASWAYDDVPGFAKVIMSSYTKSDGYSIGMGLESVAWLSLQKHLMYGASENFLSRLKAFVTQRSKKFTEKGLASKLLELELANSMSEARTLSEQLPNYSFSGPTREYYFEKTQSQEGIKIQLKSKRKDILY